MNRRTLLIGAPALGLVAFGGGASILNRQRQAEAEALAAAAVRGIERRAPRTIYPRVWIGWSLLRGLVNPVLDWGVDHHRTVQRLVRQVEARRRVE